MADIVVAHRDLTKLGGGEAVCMTTLEALQDEHNVTLLTVEEVNSFSAINEYFNTSVSEINIEYIDPPISGLEKIERCIEKSTNGKLDYLLNIVYQSVYHRYCIKSCGEADILISTWDEITTQIPTIQYVHYPNRYYHLMPNDSIAVSGISRFSLRLYKALARKFAGFNPSQLQEVDTVANSEYTATQFERWYNFRPEILYPPIDTTGLSPSPDWEDRENGFIFLSRIHPCKNLHQIIDILSKIHEEQEDIHFHIIGPRDEDAPQYYQEILSLSNEHEFIQFEGEMHGEELEQMLKTHKYGISGNPEEQFGMAIAEMVAAGMIPFVPDGGDQRNIVNNQEKVVFNSFDDAVSKILEIHLDEELRKEVQAAFPDVSEEFGKKTFKNRICDLVESSLQRNYC
ncbi:glycosyltransferase family 4 protein [Halobacterium salinarum]|uniref:glycosyltransferase family 4 protein n=1 Tax=Halobacterium salinarum TaxID=2242 RepID=UPI0025553A0D|nr:glycosyltransferase [Halobacterium salinarum]MDL0145392.1 glycosyltransferase [Halobacterium salinarum]